MNLKRPSRPPRGNCPNELNPDGSLRDSCPLQCKYNFFESDELTIHTYELKCLDCGWRDTIGFRSDEADECEDVDPRQCPFCQNCNLTPGKNPCENA